MNCKLKGVALLVFLFSFYCSSAQEKIRIFEKADGFFIKHVVLPNENFLKLASLYNLAPVKIASYNNLSLSKNLLPGDTINIPLYTYNFEQAGKIGTYEVLVPLFFTLEKDEKLQAVSQKFNGVDIGLLKAWNSLAAEELKKDTDIIVGHLRVKSALANYFSKKESTVAGNITTTPAPAPKAETLKLFEQPTITIDTFGKYSSDDLLVLAKKAAFENKNYPLAINILKIGLAKSPDYSDLRIFLGRIYTWNDEVDSARKSFEYVMNTDSTYIENYIALADLEYWNDRTPTALEVVNKGLQFNSNSKELLLRKVKYLRKLNRPAEAQEILNKLIKLDPKNTEVRALLGSAGNTLNSDMVGVSYDYTYFDKQFSNAWHLVSIDYTKQTNLGSVTGRISYANRFNSNGVQYEVEGYPNISRRFYSYVSFAYSDEVGVFPKYRGGFSLYATLPASFDAEAGFRYLQFTDATWIYTAALGKYHKNWLFNARTYLTPGNDNLSQSYSIGGRYYYGGAYDFLGLVIGRGISPDERANAVLINSKYNLQTQKATATIKHEINNKHIVTLNAGWINTEYLRNIKGNQVECGLSYQLKM